MLFTVMYNQPFQIHVLEGGEIRIYSRNSENNTTKYPDIIARMPKVGAVLRPGLRSLNDAGVFLFSFFLPETLALLKKLSVWTIMLTHVLAMHNFPFQMSQSVTFFPAQVLKDSVTSCIIDSEAVAWDVDKHQILPFQVLSTRKKKVRLALLEGVSLL